MTAQTITSDIYFAAALLSFGGEVVSTDRTDVSHIKFTVSLKASSIKFSSENLPEPPVDEEYDASIMETCKKLWANGKLLVNAVDYKNALQRIRTLIHSS